MLSVPEFPPFVYHSKHDRLPPLNDARNMVRNWCNDGGNILFVSDELSNHASLHITGAADAINFHVERLIEHPMAPGCTTRRTFTSMLDPGAPAAFESGLLNVTRALLHQPIRRSGVLAPLLPLIPHE
ncbi:hypothetical protein BC940DRAFT_334216 [Gongronella butleri]|nr:hypothetical protein BC940DRAFT_334216 [Gongronella butleri]